MENYLGKKLRHYKRKYYQNRLIKGGLITLSSMLGVYLLIIALEYNFHFNSTTRTVLFFLAIGSSIGLIYVLIGRDLLRLLEIGRQPLTNEQAARDIGEFFPEISDKLLNTLQLQTLSNTDSDLIAASIAQKLKELQPFQFVHAVDFRVNLKYLRYLGFIMLSTALMGLAVPGLIPDGGTRMINYDREYVPMAPFQFALQNKDLSAFRNDDLEISVRLDGDEIPDNVYLDTGGRLIKLKKESTQHFTYRITNIQQPFDFRFEAAGFSSERYTVPVYDRPELSGFNVKLDYPAHTEMKDKLLSGVGSFLVPEGTTVEWTISTTHADSTAIAIDDKRVVSPYNVDNQLYNLKWTFVKSAEYEIRLHNDKAQNKEQLRYKVDVVKDQFPDIQVEYYLDTILYDYVIISGSTKDDYGITAINVHVEKSDSSEVASIFTGLKPQHSFYHHIPLDGLPSRSRFELYASVTDNDMVNGRKTSKSRVFRVEIPGKDAIEDAIAGKSRETESQLDESIDEAKRINDKLKALEERLRSKKSMEWQEEKMLEDILEQRRKMEESLKELRKQYEELRNSEDKFNDRSKGVKEKAQKLQNLMDEVLDDETKRMYEELQRLLEDKQDLQQIQQQLRDIRPSEEDMEKELERALELFKRLKLESELEKASKELKELGDQQKRLGDETLDEDQDLEKIGQEQDEVNDSFEELQKKIEDLNELNQELNRPEPIENTTNEQEEIQQNLDEIREQLQQQQRKSGGQNQKNTGQKMQQLGKKMEQMQMNMEMQMMTENAEHLRNILDDLVKLSFEPDSLLDAFREVRQVDPRFVELSQEQLKLRDDAQVIEDSLLSLADRVVQISSFVTREVSEVNRNIDGAVDELKARNRSKALSHQQFAMASINNLALLLDDVLRQMQMAMREAMGQPQDADQGNESLPNLKQLQEQLSKRIEELKDSGMKGRKLSEELAKMAAEQEMLRNELQKLQDKLEGQDNEEASGNLGEALDEMEKNEVDLVNKRLTQELINRQEAIMTRLLQAEDALREQEFDDEREGESALDYQNNIPKAFEEYLKARQKEIELLKTVPLDLTPFYKKEVNDYFRRISNQN